MKAMACAIGAVVALWIPGARAEAGSAPVERRAIPPEVMAYPHPLSTYAREFWVASSGTPDPEWKGVAVRKGLQVLSESHFGIQVWDTRVEAPFVTSEYWELDVQTGELYYSRDEEQTGHQEEITLSAEDAPAQREGYLAMLGQMRAIVLAIAAGGDYGLDFFPAIPALAEVSDYLAALAGDLALR